MYLSNNTLPLTTCCLFHGGFYFGEDTGLALILEVATNAAAALQQDEDKKTQHRNKSFNTTLLH